ncbi:MAG: hypothetical protein ABJF88_14130 [Rhodothermales bacterium]
MPELPAFCDNCGAVFGSGFVIDNSVNVTLSGNKSGPCPVCGGMGSVPDGVFNFVGETMEILAAPQRTTDQLRRLAQILGSARQRNATPEEVKKEIRKEVPELSKLADWLPANRTELYAVIAIIVTLLFNLVDAGVKLAEIGKDSLSRAEVEKIAEQAVRGAYGKPQAEVVREAQIVVERADSLGAPPPDSTK